MLHWPRIRRLEPACFLALAILSVRSPTVWADIRESFESPETTWRFEESDCRLEVELHERTFAHAHGGNGCEQLRYVAAVGGTRAMLAHSIQPAVVIDELEPSVWVRSDRPGIQVFARVVFPRTLDSQGRAVTQLLPGESYTEVGQWQQLRVTGIGLSLQRQVRLLRSSRHLDSVDDAEAYIDMVVLNAYTGRGRTNLWLDDLEVTGFAAAPGVAFVSRNSRLPRTHGGRGPETGAPIPRVRGSLFQLDEKPYVVRAIEWRGEPFSFLAQLGFNTVWMSTPPTEDQVIEAERDGMWLVSPPPPRLAESTPRLSRRHLCWALPGQHTPRDLAGVSQQISELRREDFDDATRPILCGVVQGVSRFASVADLVLLHRAPIGTSIQLADSLEWWREQTSRIRPAKPVWATIQTELSESLRFQIRSMAGGQPPPVDVEPAQIWLQVAAAAAGGARGFLFRSDTRLDQPPDPLPQRAAALEVANQYLRTMDPWLAAGRVGRVMKLSDSNYKAAILETDRSRLLIAMSATSDQQFTIGMSHGPRQLRIPVPDRQTDRVFRVTSSGSEPMRAAVGKGYVDIQDPALVTMVVFTNESLVLSHLRRRTDRMRRETLQREIDLATRTWEETDRVLRELAELGRLRPDTELAMTNTRYELERLRHSLANGEARLTAQGLVRVVGELRRIRQQYWLEASSEFPAPMSHPLATGFRTVPAHWKMARRMAGAKWGPNVMAAGRMESLAHMQDARWGQFQSDEANVYAKAELSLESPATGRYSLKLQASSSLPRSQLESWPIWITSAPVPVQAGQLLRITGRVKMPEKLAATADGLLVFDSLTGVEQATRIQSTRGWEEFWIYRVAPNSGDLTVVMALSGLGTAYVDDLELSLLEP